MWGGVGDVVTVVSWRPVRCQRGTINGNLATGNHKGVEEVGTLYNDVGEGCDFPWVLGVGAQGVLGWWSIGATTPAID